MDRGDLPPREGVWFAPPRPVRRTLRKLPDWYALLWMPSVVYRLVLRGSVARPPHWVSLAEAAGWILLVVLALGWKASEMLARRSTGADRTFSERPEGMTEYPVEIIISVDGIEVGMDRGIVWFEDGLLRFNGAATSFALSRTDFLTSDTEDRKRSHMKRPPLALWLRSEGHPAYVQFLPLTAWHNLFFGYVLGRFLGRRTVVTGGRQWPPLLRYGELPFDRLPGTTPEAIGAEAARTGSARGVVRF